LDFYYLKGETKAIATPWLGRFFTLLLQRLTPFTRPVTVLRTNKCKQLMIDIICYRTCGHFSQAVWPVVLLPVQLL
jgi:hypothetical protein